MSALSTVFAYHERTKHHFHRFAPSLGYMDWANQPHPFRYYRGASETRLQLDRKPPAVAYDHIYELDGLTPAPVCLGTIADFFRYSLALSAWKQAGANRWALRVNPSSGNLHPTEAYVLLDSTANDDQTPALYHYVSETHCLERRASLSDETWMSLKGDLPAGSFLVGLSSVPWREAWKYGERAFRYCQHDIGHALAALRLSAALCGWRLALMPSWSSDDVATLLGLNREDDFLPAEHEEPELLAVVTPNTAAQSPAVFPAADDSTLESLRTDRWYGRPNRLSDAHVAWPVIDEVAAATRMPRNAVQHLATHATFHDRTVLRSSPEVDARQIILQRRSCLALDGHSSLARERFLQILARTLPGAGPPWDALFWQTTVHLALFVHRVDDVVPGLYFLVRDSAKLELLKESMRDTFLWETPAGAPASCPLYRLKEADLRHDSKTLSCHQDIAADGFFSLGMIAEFAEPIQRHGTWFYRNLFWEAGMVGQVLYLEAEAAGARSTGIGCYFDDPVHELLGFTGNRFQSLYHFTVGAPVQDRRLQTWPPYS